MNRRTWIAIAVGGLGAMFACSDGHPEAAAGAPGDPTPACTAPAEGCACTAGSHAECGTTLRGGDDFVVCSHGTRSCVNGGWGSCVTDGTTSTRSTSALVYSPVDGVHPQNFGAPAACGSIDLCDPYCQAQTDTATGIIVTGFGIAEGGLVVVPSDAGPTSTCGNSNVTGNEECDDGNVTSGDGCSGTCKIEIGYKCPTPGQACVPATCGDGITEGAERCDDNNLRPFDGCSPTCQIEPVCDRATNGCVAICGDGIKFPSENCDDGNTNNGDGCSSTCTVEPGASCMTITSAAPGHVDVPIIYRDFKPSTNPDFEFPFSGPGSLATGVIPNVTKNLLAGDQEPAFNATQGTVTSQTTFDQWFHDTPGVNRVILDSLRLDQQPDGSYLYNSRAMAPIPFESFFPIDNRGFGNYAATGHNYSFTSELRYPFTYQGGEVLDFIGDDDLWVFVNGHLAVDLGGAHIPASGSVTLDAAAAATFGLTIGGSYRLDVFQAERHSTGSSYKLTLRGFLYRRSVCTPPLPPGRVFVRDFQASCPSDSKPVWQLFQWQALAPPGTSIDFRATTATTQGALPNAPPGPAPTSVPIGAANPGNSPLAGPLAWVNDTSAGNPVTVAEHLASDGNTTTSMDWLRVYMTFNTLPTLSPVLVSWRQVYDCVPAE